MSKIQYSSGYEHHNSYGTLKYLHPITNSRSKWECFCGVAFETYNKYVVNNNKKSCGCLKYKKINNDIQYLNELHDCIKQRCYNSSNPSFKNYGGRGIVLGSEWKNNKKKFIVDILFEIGHRPSENHQLDRINVNGNYCSTNLRWATSKENNRNKRTNNLVKINDIVKPMVEWVEQSGLRSSTIKWRIDHNWTDDKVLINVLRKNKKFNGSELRAIHTGIISRCYDLNNINYKNYGGRGITVFEPWKNSYKGFKNDILDQIGNRPSSKYHLDRIDNDGNYEPNNLQWATAKQNARNRRSNNLIEINGEIKTLVEWSELSGINRSTIKRRILSGYIDKDIISPINKRKLTDCEIENVKNLHNSGFSYRAIASKINCSFRTIINVILERGAYKNKGT